MRGGYQVFKHLSGCVGEDKAARIYSDYTYFENTEAFYKSLKTECSIDISTHSFGKTLDAVSGHENITGSTYVALSKTKETYLEKSCLTKVDEDLLSSFEKLPFSIKKPESLSGWKEYDNFLHQYGSHVVTSASYGSALYQHAFDRSSKLHTKQDFAIEVCAALSPPGTIAAKVSVCSGVTIDQTLNTTSREIKKQFVARGGSMKTRQQLYQDPTSDETRAKFLGEAEESDEPISYAFMPIWGLLSLKYAETEHYPRLVNLRSYYQGYLSYPCYGGMSKSITDPIFVVRGSLKNPVFKCVIPHRGCETDSDCKVYPRTWPLSDDCFCKNNHCVKIEERKWITGEIRKIAFKDSESWGKWRGNCEIVNDNQCICTTQKNKGIVVWTSENVGGHVPNRDEL
ncbi:DELTA-alicitoxin-Pse2b-like [Amphiura filiformis]|uniref:DELTA-alicitoxin-Pse2b-like n=1 Tax=Amphiura filiformis TaxID=82378 RepID=UPI003B2283BB